VTDGDTLQGQSDHLANLQFGWEDENAKSQATLLLTYVSERISARGRTGFPDLIQGETVNLDFTYRKGFEVMGKEMEFGFEARNLLGEDSEEFQELGGGRVDTNTYDLGRGVSFSISAKF
jgi:outer membrane receptor protein involved in Fe transport